MTRDDIQKRLLEILHDQIGVPAADVKPTQRLVADLGCDSLDLLEIVMASEEEFGVELPDDEAEQIQTVEQAVNLIAAKAQVTA